MLTRLLLSPDEAASASISTETAAVPMTTAVDRSPSAVAEAMADKTVPQKKVNYQRWAVSLPIDLRADALAAVQELAPKDADPVLLDIAKRAATDMINAMPENVKGVQVKIECSGFAAKQLMILAIPQMVK